MKKPSSKTGNSLLDIALNKSIICFLKEGVSKNSQSSQDLGLIGPFLIKNYFYFLKNYLI